VIAAAVLVGFVGAVFAATRGAAPMPAGLVAVLVVLAVLGQGLVYRGLHGGPRWLTFASAALAAVIPPVAGAWYGSAWEGWGPTFWRVTALYVGLSAAVAFAARVAGAARARRAAAPRGA
jgi:hypothetical protein